MPWGRFFCPPRHAMGTFLLSPRRFSFSIYTCGNSIRANPHVHFQHPYIRNAANKQIRTYSSDIYTCGKCQTSTSARTFPASVHAECSGIAKTHVLFQHSYTRNTAYAQIRTYISCIRTCGMQRDCQDACTLPALIHAETAYEQIHTYISCIRTCGMQRDC